MIHFTSKRASHAALRSETGSLTAARLLAFCPWIFPAMFESLGVRHGACTAARSSNAFAISIKQQSTFQAYCSRQQYTTSLTTHCYNGNSMPV